MSLEDFLCAVSERIYLDVTMEQVDMALDEEVGLDSLQMMEIIVLVSELWGRTVSEQHAMSLNTLREWHQSMEGQPR